MTSRVLCNSQKTFPDTFPELDEIFLVTISLLTADDFWFFCNLYPQFIGPIYLLNKLIDMRLFLKCKEVLDQRPKFYGCNRRFKTYGYSGKRLRLFLRSKVWVVLFLVFSKMEAEMCFSLHRYHLGFN